MQRTRYLNVILTVNAILLAALWWAGLAERPLFSQMAAAQSPPPASAQAPGMPNAAVQRNDMVKLLREIRQDVATTNQLLTSGAVKVQATNLDEIRLQAN